MYKLLFFVFICIVFLIININCSSSSSGLTQITKTVDENVQSNFDDKNPSTNATPSSGKYSTPPYIQLIIDEPGETYYTLDGTVPTRYSLKYSSYIFKEGNFTLNFFSIDKNGNIEGYKSEKYEIDCPNIADIDPQSLILVDGFFYSSHKPTDYAVGISNYPSKIMRHKNDSNLDIIESITFPLPFPLKGITYDGINFWGALERDASFKKDIICKFSLKMGQITVLETFDIPKGIEGITYDGVNLWAIFAIANKIFKYDKLNPEKILKSYDLPQLYGRLVPKDILFLKDYIWTSYDPATLDSKVCFIKHNIDETLSVEKASDLPYNGRYPAGIATDTAFIYSITYPALGDTKKARIIKHSLTDLTDINTYYYNE